MAISTFTLLLSSVCASGCISGLGWSFCGYIVADFFYFVVGIFNSTVQCLCTPGTVSRHYLGRLFLVKIFPPFVHHNCKIESGLEPLFFHANPFLNQLISIFQPENYFDLTHLVLLIISICC